MELNQYIIYYNKNKKPCLKNPNLSKNWSSIYFFEQGKVSFIQSHSKTKTFGPKKSLLPLLYVYSFTGP